MNGPARARVMAAALATLIALATFHPGASGDLLRAWVVLGAGLIVGLLAWRRHQDPADPRVGDLLPLLAVGVVVATAALQLIPLPRALIQALAPATATLFDLEQAAQGSTDASFRPLSLEPGATARAALLALAYLAVFVSARAIARERSAASALLIAIATIGAGCALYALAHQAGLDPGDPWHGRARGPFVNPNHLATFLLLCLGPALGLLLVPDRSETGRRGLVALAAVLIVIGIVATRSRGGVIAAAVTALLVLPAAGGGSRRRTLGALGAAIVILGLGLALSDPEPLERRIDEHGLALSGRLDNWATAGGVVRAHPWAGSGLGTFDDASRAVLDPEQRRLTRPGAAHNDYLELAATCGVPAALLALLLLAASLRPAVRGALATSGSQRAVVLGCLAAVGGAGVHALVDFGLSIPGSGLLFATCAGLACGVVPAPPRESVRLQSRGRQAIRIGAAVLLALAAGPLILQSAREERARAAHARAHAPGVKPGLRATLAKEALTPLRLAAQGSFARADISFRRAEAILASQPAWSGEARAAAVAAVRGAPGRAEHQAQLALILLNLAGADAPPDPALLREGEGRLRLAVFRAPAQPTILRAALDAELSLIAKTGQSARLARAKELIRRVHIHDPNGAQWVESVLKRDEAALGAFSAPLRAFAHESR